MSRHGSRSHAPRAGPLRQSGDVSPAAAAVMLSRTDTTRRQFLTAAAGVPAAVAVQTPPASAVVLRDSSFDRWVEIETANLRHNVAEIHRRTARPILAVIKNNGYGGGVANIARVLDSIAEIAGFAVVKLHEAVA